MLLNNLTMETFDSISDGIVTYANISETEKDARTLIQITRLVFEAAIVDMKHSALYARLCQKIMEQISPKVQHDGIKNAHSRWPVVP